MTKRQTGIQLPQKPEKLSEPKKLRPRQPPGTCWIPGEWRFNYPDRRWVWNAGHWRDIEPHQVPESPDKTDFEEDGSQIPDMKRLATLYEAMQIVEAHSEELDRLPANQNVGDPNLRAQADQITETFLNDLKIMKRYIKKGQDS